MSNDLGSPTTDTTRETFAPEPVYVLHADKRGRVTFYLSPFGDAVTPLLAPDKLGFWLHGESPDLSVRPKELGNVTFTGHSDASPYARTAHVKVALRSLEPRTSGVDGITAMHPHILTHLVEQGANYWNATHPNAQECEAVVLEVPRYAEQGPIAKYGAQHLFTRDRVTFVVDGRWRQTQASMGYLFRVAYRDGAPYINTTDMPSQASNLVGTSTTQRELAARFSEQPKLTLTPPTHPLHRPRGNEFLK